MHIEITPNEPTRVLVRYQDKVVYDQLLEANKSYVIDAEHPKTCGKAQAFLVFGEDEMMIGEADYGDCQCPAGTHQ